MLAFITIDVEIPSDILIVNCRIGSAACYLRIRFISDVSKFIYQQRTILFFGFGRSQCSSCDIFVAKIHLSIRNILRNTDPNGVFFQSLKNTFFYNISSIQPINTMLKYT